MGMDLHLVRYSGRNELGYLRTKNVEEEYNWDTTRYTVRVEFSETTEFDYIGEPEVEFSFEVIFRPNNFQSAYLWASKLPTLAERTYIETILRILEKDDSLYLEESC